MSNFQTESSCVLDTGTKKVWNFYTIEFTGIELYGLIVCAISKKRVSQIYRKAITILGAIPPFTWNVWVKNFLAISEELFKSNLSNNLQNDDL